MLILVVRNVQLRYLIHLVRSLYPVSPVYPVLLLRPVCLVQQLPVHLLPPITLTSYLPYIFMHCSFKNLSFVPRPSTFASRSFVISSLFRHHIPPFPSLHSPFEGSQRQLGMCPARMELLNRKKFSSFFPSLHSSSPWERAGVRIPFLSPRNPDFNIFSAVV